MTPLVEELEVLRSGLHWDPLNVHLPWECLADIISSETVASAVCMETAAIRFCGASLQFCGDCPVSFGKQYLSYPNDGRCSARRCTWQIVDGRGRPSADRVYVPLIDVQCQGFVIPGERDCIGESCGARAYSAIFIGHPVGEIVSTCFKSTFLRKRLRGYSW